MSEVDRSLNLSASVATAPALIGNASILVIDDEAGIRESLEVLLTLEGYGVRTANDGEQGLRILEIENFDLVLLDLALPGQSGLELLPQIKERQPETPVIMITAYGTVENVVEAIRAGAENFVQKPWDNEKLMADIRSAVARHRAEEENLQLKRTLKQRYNFTNIVGKSELMLRVFDLIAQVAPRPIDGADSGRERYRQGDYCEGDPCEFAAQRQAVCADQHRCSDAVGAAGVDVVWPCEGRVYFRGGFEEGPV